MIRLKTVLALVVLLPVFTACDSGTDEVDPLLDFEGSFRLEAFQFRFTQTDTENDTTLVDTTLAVTREPNLFFERADPGASSMTLDPTELIQDTHRSMWEAVAPQEVLHVAPEFPRQPNVAVQGNSFEVESTRFITEITVVTGEMIDLPWDAFSVSGTLSGDILTLEFEMVTEILQDVLEIRGVVSGVRR